MNALKLSLLAVILIVLYVSAAAAVDARPQLLALERELNNAIITRDRQRVGEILSNDWMLITSGSRIVTKERFLAQFASAQVTFIINEASEVNVRIWGDTAVLTGVIRQEYTSEGKLFDNWFRYTDTWVRRGEKWQQVSGHATRLERPPT